MATSQSNGEGGSQASGQSIGQSSLPAQFTIVVRDLTSQGLKQCYHFSYFRLLSSAIIRLITLFCDVKQVFYTAERGLPSTRRTIIITDQIFTNFVNNKASNDIASQLYPDLPRPGLLRKPPPQRSPSNVYLNPFLSDSFASKVAQPAPRPTGPRGLQSRAPTPSGSTQMQTNALATQSPHLSSARSCPPTLSVPVPYLPALPPPELPTYSLSFHERKYYIPPKPNYSDDLLNMIMDPAKNTLLIVCAKKGQ